MHHAANTYPQVRCDRKDPCGNCQDGNVPCLRNRPRIGSSRATGSPLYVFCPRVEMMTEVFTHVCRRDTQPEHSQRLVPIQPALGDLDSVSQDDSALIPMEAGVPFRLEETRSNEIVPFFEDAESFSGYPSAGILHQPQYNLPQLALWTAKASSHINWNRSEIPPAIDIVLFRQRCTLPVSLLLLMNPS